VEISPQDLPEGLLCPGNNRLYAMALLPGDLPGIEQVQFDSPGDVGDTGLSGLAGREVAGLLGLAGAGPARAVTDVKAGHEDLQQERG
jgi:hypothetical protein